MEPAASGRRPSVPQTTVLFKAICEKRLSLEGLELPERDKLPPTWKGLIGGAIGDVADPQEPMAADVERVVRRRERFLAVVRQALVAQWGARKCIEDALGLAQGPTRHAASGFIQMDRKSGLADVDCTELRTGATALAAVVLAYESRAAVLFGSMQEGGPMSAGEALSPANARAYAYAAARQAMATLPEQAHAGFVAEVQTSLSRAKAIKPGEGGLCARDIQLLVASLAKQASASLGIEGDVQPRKDMVSSTPAS